MINFDYAALRLIGLTPSIANHLHRLAVDFADEFAVENSLQVARITDIHRDRLVLHNGSTKLTARALPLLLQELANEESSLAVGDWGLLSGTSEGGYHFIARMPAMTHLARRNSDGRLQALASNIDTAFLVMGLDNDFNLRRLERYLALVHAAGVTPVVLLSKADQHAHALERLDEVKQRLSHNVPVFAINGLSDATINLLAPWMSAGQSLIVLGSSGAGKSTLTNTLAHTQQEIGSVRAGDDRGHHTTTARSLHLCAGGACIIDTPGLRSLHLNLDEEALSASFTDIETLAEACQFRDCGHQMEPGCAVKGIVDEDRLKNYQKLLRESRRNQQTPLDKIAARSKWKVLIRSVKQRDKLKHGVS